MMNSAMICGPIVSMPDKNHKRDLLSNSSKRQGGFTLLEILAAMAVLSVVVSLVFGSFSAVFYNADSIGADSDLVEMGSACLQRIKMDLLAVHVLDSPRYQPPDSDGDPDIYRVVGTEQLLGGRTYAKLRFATLAHLPLTGLPGESIAEIIYYVQRDENGDYLIRRSDQTYPYPEFEENTKDPVLCENVLGFAIRYFDFEGNEYTQWDSESDDNQYSTPNSVGIDLTIGTQERNISLKTEIKLPMYRHLEVKR